MLGRETPSCQRCRQIGAACEGYGLRLSWLPYNPHDPTDQDHTSSNPESPHQLQPRASRRSLISVGSFPSLPSLPTSELEAALSAIDEWCPGESSKLEQGAFSVFSASRIEPLRPDVYFNPVQLSSDSSETPPLEDEAYNFYEPSETRAPSRDIDESFQPTIRLSGDIRGNSVSAQTPSSVQNQVVSTAPRHLDAITMPSKQKRLIHHWVTFTSRKIVLIDEPHNPCRTMMLPMAMKGLVSRARGSTSDVAIFHALCASAAYNLFELSGRTNEQDRVLALYHDSEAVHHLRHNLSRADEHRDQSFAMAIMACITVEAVSGTTQRWRTHVSGGLAYLAKLQSQGVDQTALSVFRQHMVKMAILCGVSVPDDLKSFLHDESGASDGLEYTFPYYGISRSFLRAHDRINLLLESATLARTPETEKELDAFELQLYLDFPSLPLLNQSMPTIDKRTGIVVHHTSMAFYYAGLVFFQRSVRSAPISAVQELVKLGVQELESIDRFGQGELGCLMLWPVLVLGADCDTPSVQGKMRAWFQAQRKLGFRNLFVLEEIVAKVWAARASPAVNTNNADWRQVIAQAEYDVFRL